MMNSSLPSLLDAIFGKEDLASVSLDEMYELINEFPSFNAAHFLLSKKLKQGNEDAYEKETMRTALYFNNAFWLQSVLDEENHPVPEHLNNNYREEKSEEITEQEIHPIENLTVITEELLPETAAPAGRRNDEENENITHIVTSFDELISKYHFDTTTEPVDETKPEPPIAIASEAEPEYADVQETIPGYQTIDAEEAEKPEANATTSFEIQEEIVNDYGIFEEVIVKKHDQDLSAFDKPIDNGVIAEIPAESETPATEIPETGNQSAENESIVENPIPEKTDWKPVDHDYDAFDRPLEYGESEENPAESSASPEMIIGTAIPETGKTDNHVSYYHELSESVAGAEINAGAMAKDADETEKPPGDSFDREEDMNVEMRQLSERFSSEQHKSTAAFDPRKAESIVFAPYHLVDYFASQGIKLVLEDNPPDQFGKQLKSFTDWLKVMKKLPVQPTANKTDEQEVDRIRHFAAHSIEERDILTESMAEVLAKQGMYENAIALYQKLSLIYPPKSAYFASRIEQLKASLP